MYPSVEAYFKAEYPGLVECLSKAGPFWWEISENNITIQRLVEGILSHLDLVVTEPEDLKSQTFQAEMALLLGISTGKIPFPKVSILPDIQTFL